MFQGTGRAYDSDDYAQLATFAIDHGYLETLEPRDKMLVLLPLQNSESIENNEMCLELFKKYHGMDHKGVRMTQEHIAILKNFGRYPHRNAALDRELTEEEKRYFLEGKLSSFEKS